ncbi:MAG: SLBB domain-containing protein [Clostridia bacterium]|nr:SLBB domain-containing protein [Clostridia bacterium]MBQ8758556.1 SLBB domain-containing protein [Clostridia bacterium]
MDFKALSEILKNAGVVGAGGAGFPSYAKLNEKADTIILNCAECEPLLKLHRQVLEYHAKDIVFALETVKNVLKADRVIIAVKPHYKDAIEATKEAIEGKEGFSIGLLPEIYPAGDEVVTIYETTGRVVPAGSLPISVGCVVYNVETMLNAAYAIKENKGVTYKYITVAGEVKKPCTLKVPLGMTYGEIVELCGGATIENPVIFAGGPMTGFISSKRDVVTKTSNAILVLDENQYIIKKRTTPVTISLKRAMSACCNCMMCTDLCSRNLLGHPIDPQKFMMNVTGGVTKDVKPYIDSFFCCSCGICEYYACFQGLSPTTLLGMTKGKLKKAGVQIPKDIETKEVHKQREFRTVPITKLVRHLGLVKYDVECPLDDTLVKADSVKIKLGQHIGAPAVSAVKVGDKVMVGDVIAKAADGLSVNIHASISGTVDEVTDAYIIIKA